MKALMNFLAAAGLLLAAGSGWAGAPGASAELIDRGGHRVGEAYFRSAPHGVLIEISVRGLPPGPHAVLLHASNTCDADVEAGPVFDFEPGRAHGYFARGGHKPGDLPTQFAGADGVLHASIFTSAFSLGEGRRSLLARGGVTIVVHANADDYTRQPDGGAGPALACGHVIRQAVRSGHQRRRR